MLLKNGKLILNNSILFGDVRINGSRIIEIGVGLTGVGNEEIIDVGGRYVTSGFIDIHTHGGYGRDFMDCTKEAFDNALRFHADNGTTTVVATSCTAPKEKILDFLRYSRQFITSNASIFANVAGVHLEGPYLSVKNRGAQDEKNLADPIKDDYSYMIENADIIKTVTIAPELDGAAEMARSLTEKGIVVCGGHDDGLYPNFIPTIRNGLKHLTHAYSAMSELKYVNGIRNVGLREYGLIDDALSVEFIADNRHIPPELALLIYKAKGADNCCVVSDSLSCAGQPQDGRLYKLGNGDSAQLVKIDTGIAMLADGSKFAGSITPVRKMVKNLVDAGIPLVDAVKMGTSTPARIIGEKDIGSIAVGKKADLCVLENDFSLVTTIINGTKYKREAI